MILVGLFSGGSLLRRGAARSGELYQRARIFSGIIQHIADLYVELRPTGLVQVFMVELHDGTHHELCPVAWPGAGRLFRILTRRLERRRRRE